jgi:hypothetical protein
MQKITRCLVERLATVFIIVEGVPMQLHRANVARRALALLVNLEEAAEGVNEIEKRLGGEKEVTFLFGALHSLTLT